MDSFLCDRIPKIEARIVALEDALSALASDAITSYQLDDGQTKQQVTKASIPSLQAQVNKLLNDREVLRQRCGLESGVTLLRPF